MRAWAGPAWLLVPIGLLLCVVLLSAAIRDRSKVLELSYNGSRNQSGPEAKQGSASPDDVWFEPSQPPSIDDQVRYETQWLLACQLPDGAIAQTPIGDRIVPYFGNIAAAVMADIEPDRARQYIVWYLAHMNRPDRFGISGTIYDFHLTDEGLRPTYSYDSADGYAATFLSLVAHYLRVSGDEAFVSANLEAIDLTAKVLLQLQDNDGLVRVAPNSSTKYLMDNCEAFRGLKDWAEVLLSLGRTQDALQCSQAAERIRQGIEQVLYNPSTGAYAHSLWWFGRRFPNPAKWYPDAVSQLDVIAYGILDPKDPKAVKVWQDFNSAFPNWDQGLKDDGFPWAEVALTAVMMGDGEKAERFLDWASSYLARHQRPYPWYVLESASLVRLYQVLRGSSQTARMASPEVPATVP